MNGIRTTKVFIDSRYAISGSESNVQVEVPGGIDLGRDARVYVSEFTCVASWDTLDVTNNILYLIENDDNRPLALDTGVYDLQTLRTELDRVLNGPGKGVGVGTYVVTLVSTGAGGTQRYLDITLDAGVFKLPNNAGILEAFGLSNPPSTNKLFVWPEGMFNGDSHTSGFVDLRRAHSIYVHSPSFGGYNAVGPKAMRTILAKIPVTVGYGGVVHWQSSGGVHEGMECGVQGLNVLNFELRDVHGEYLDLRGTSWSMTLLFG